MSILVSFKKGCGMGTNRTGSRGGRGVGVSVSHELIEEDVFVSLDTFYI